MPKELKNTVDKRDILSKTVDMTVGSPTKHILKFAFPLIITNLGQQLYMIVDAAIVGRGVGVRALAAVGATDWIYWLILWNVTGLTQGFSTFIARYFGEKNYRDMNKSIASSIVLCIAIGGIFTVAGLACARPLLELLDTPDDIIGSATVYLVTMISGTVVVVAYNMAASVLRAFGDGKTPLIAMIIAALLNIGLDCLFVFVFKMGIFGAALASVMSQAVAFLFCMAAIAKIEDIKLSKESFTANTKMLFNMMIFGLPLAAQYILISLGGIILQSSINAEGSAFIAGYTATNKVYGLLESSSISLGLAASTFLAQNYGAGLFKRFKKGLASSIVIVSFLAIAVTAITVPLRRYILQLFLDVNEAEGEAALDIAVHYMTIIVSCLIILYFIHIYRNALQAIGIASWSMVSGFLEFVARVVMSKVIINYIGSDALFISEPVAWLGALLGVMLPYFYYSRKLLSGKKEKDTKA